MKRSLPLLTVTTAALLGACALQRYEPRPLEPARLEEAFHARSLTGDTMRDYLLAQGYPQAAWPIKSWGLRELAQAAFHFNPTLATARARLAGAEAAVLSAGQKPNPTLSAVSEHHSRTEGGVSPWTLGVSLEIPLTTANKRALRIEQATHLAEAERLAIGAAVWRVYAGVRDSFAALHAAERRVELRRRELAIREEIAAMLEKRLAAGMAGTLELQPERRLLLQARHALAASEAELPQQRAALAAAIGVAPTALDDIRLAPSGAMAPLPEAAAQLQQAALLNRLELRAALSRYAAAESALQLEIARQYPDIALSPGYLFDQDDHLWTLGLALPLALLNRNEGPIAEARARREVAAREFLERQAGVIGEQAQALARARSAAAAHEQARQQLAQLQSDAQRAVRQFHAGQLDRLELRQIEALNLEQEHRLLDAEEARQSALAALENALERPLAETDLALPGIPH